MKGETKAIFVRENIVDRGQKMGNLCHQLTTGSLIGQAGTKDAWWEIRLELKAKARFQRLLCNKQRNLKVVGFCDDFKLRC